MTALETYTVTLLVLLVGLPMIASVLGLVGFSYLDRKGLVNQPRR